MKRFVIGIIGILALGCAGTKVNARVLKTYHTDDRRSRGVMELVVDSVDFRTDLMRVYGKLKGMPHTSHRIDSIVLQQADGSKSVSTDIDGVDIKRWFQWEDDGLIPVEIDFKPMKKTPKAFIITTSGPKGNCVWSVVNVKTSNNSSKR